MEEKFEKMIRDFKKELIDDYSDKKITQSQFDVLYRTIDNMVCEYYNNADALEMIKLVNCFKIAYANMK